VNSEFSVEEHNHGPAWVLAVTGELDLRTSPELEERLTRVWSAGAELVILDLRHIGADQVERVLTLTGVRDLLTVVDAPEELLA